MDRHWVESFILNVWDDFFKGAYMSTPPSNSPFSVRKNHLFKNPTTHDLIFGKPEDKESGANKGYAFLNFIRLDPQRLWKDRSRFSCGRFIREV